MKKLQIKHSAEVEKFNALKGTKTVNVFFEEVLNAYSNSINKSSNERKVVNHADIFAQILAKAKKEYVGKEIPITYFTVKANNGIAAMHHSVVMEFLQNLNIDLKTAVKKNYYGSNNLPLFLETELLRCHKNIMPKLGTYVVYFLFNEKNEVVYVGMTMDFQKRIQSHSKDKVFEYWKVLSFKNEQDCLDAEKHIIALISP